MEDAGGVAPLGQLRRAGERGAAGADAGHPLAVRRENYPSRTLQVVGVDFPVVFIWHGITARWSPRKGHESSLNRTLHTGPESQIRWGQKKKLGRPEGSRYVAAPAQRRSDSLLAFPISFSVPTGSGTRGQYAAFDSRRIHVLCGDSIEQ